MWLGFWPTERDQDKNRDIEVQIWLGYWRKAHGPNEKSF